MSNVDIAKLRETDPRAFDALVAERVYGAVWVRDQDYRTDTKALVGEPYRFLTFNKALIMDLQPANGDEAYRESYDAIVPKCSTDPAADYATLKLVRETWIGKDKLAWCAMLHAIIQNREGETGALWPMMVQPGDYSSAALAVAPAEGKR